MFYKNYTTNKKMSYKRYKYASFAGLNTDYDEYMTPIRYSKNTYNLSYQDGMLKTGMGVSEPLFHYVDDGVKKTKRVEFPNHNILGVWEYVYYYKSLNRYESLLVVYCDDGYIYYNPLHGAPYGFLCYEHRQFTSKPMIVNYKINGKDVLIIVSHTDGMFVWEIGTIMKKIEGDVPMITSMCLHYERLFVTAGGDRRRIYFSDDLDPTNFNTSSTEGGFIEIVDEVGGLNKVVSFDDYVYVIRDYGLSKISAYGVQDEFSVYNLYVSSTKIYASTAVVCGDRIMFLAKDGIYYFDGVSTKRIEYNISNMLDGVDNSDALATYCDGYYYIACKLRYPNEELSSANNSLVRIDVTSGEISIMKDVEIYSLDTINDIYASYLFVCIKSDDRIVVGQVDNTGQILGVPTHKLWSSPTTDFGSPDKRKLLKEMYVISKYDSSIIIYYDNKSRTINIKGDDCIQKIKINIMAKTFKIDFVSDNIDMYISSPEVVVGV